MKATLYISLVSLLLIGCSANKYLPEGEKYFEGNIIEYQDADNLFPRDIKFGLEGDLKPDATRRYFVSRPGTWLYQSIEKPKKKKGLKHWLKYKMGSKPTYLSDVDITKNINYIEASLRRNGYFKAKVESGIDSTAHKASVVYSVTLNTPRIIDTLLFCSDPDSVCDALKNANKRIDRLNSGDLFRQEELEGTRKDLSNSFKNDGYYYFTPNFLFYRADSSDNGNKVRLKMDVRPEITEAGLSKYYIDAVSLNLSGDTIAQKRVRDSLDIAYNPDKLYLDPRKLRQYVAFDLDSIYKKSDEKLTLKQLSKLDVFDYINIDYQTGYRNGRRTLDANISATPRRKHSLRAEFNLSTTSINYTGPGLQLEYYNRNTFKGAEKLKISAVGRYEVQLSGVDEGLASYEVDLQANLLLPSVQGPLKKKVNPGNVPNTRYRLQYRLFNQPNYYAQSTFGAGYGYEWLANGRIFNDLRLVNFDYVQLLQSSEQLEDLLNQGVLSRESFEDQVIAGPSYSISINSKQKKVNIFSHYIGLSVEAAGNLLYLGYDLTGQERNENGQYTFVGVPFSQYFRLQTDLRAFIKLGKYNKLAMRQIVGVGAPYLNSSALPFAKQFFVGGASSLRGFQARSIGPGVYFSDDQGSFFDQTGDIQLEWNIENRTDMGQYLEGAIFLDAGNVWLARESAARPGGEFRFNKFLSQLAVSSGIGVRINLEFLIVRFDFGVPMRKPYLPQGQRWIWQDVDDEFKTERSNVILNFAIGYPF